MKASGIRYRLVNISGAIYAALRPRQTLYKPWTVGGNPRRRQEHAQEVMGALCFLDASLGLTRILITWNQFILPASFGQQERGTHKRGAGRGNLRSAQDVGLQDEQTFAIHKLQYAWIFCLFRAGWFLVLICSVSSRPSCEKVAEINWTCSSHLSKPYHGQISVLSRERCALWSFELRA